MEKLELEKRRFYQLVYPSRPNEWEVEDVIERLGKLESGERQLLFSYVSAVWPVSHSLCFAYLHNGPEIVGTLPAELLGDWVRELLDIYEMKGLAHARRFMADSEGNFLKPRRDRSAVTFRQVLHPMLHYVRGVSGRNFEFQVAQVPFTDTETMYLPAVINLFSTEAENRMLYKLIVSLQWAQVRSGFFSQIIGAEADGGGESLTAVEGKRIEEKLLGSFSDRILAKDLLLILLFVSGYNILKMELPGLVRQSKRLCSRILHIAGLKNEKSLRGELLLRLLDQAMGNKAVWQLPTLVGGFDSLSGFEEDGLNVPVLLSELYDAVEKVKGPYDLSELRLLLGTVDCKAAVLNVVKKRDRDKKRFIALIDEVAVAKNSIQDGTTEAASVVEEIYDTLLIMLGKKDEETKVHSDKRSVRLENEGVDIPKELLALAAEIERDLGCLPEPYVQATSGVGGGGFLREQGSGEGDDCQAWCVPSGILYDEWDYRRGGYRKGWCTLYEKSLSPARSDFVSRTLEKYRPQLNRLRRQFEMLRTRERFVRRRRHGDDIDLDALIDALGDSRAGLCPSDRLFVRLLRDERDISTLFLVDMSNSTEGWVGLAIREALVLLSESLEVVGDPYGIYGFSGMRRSKNEVYHIKHIDEPYNVLVQQRMAALKPMEYTRMGPPIRHLTKKLQEVYSKVRLLIVISDGKPEDYDDYKGQYAIEDTKKALLEARGQGVHPFCITIDKAAQEYLAHMFGARNYVFVHNVFSLPGKMAEMYRMLTS